MTRTPGPRAAEERLRRLLVMLPWLMERGDVPISEVADRFEMTADEVIAELELAAMCGLPPYADELIDVFVDDGSVYVGVPRLFTRPLRLNAVEAFELLTAGRAAMQLPGADPGGPLGRGLAKLAAAVGADEREEPLAIELDRPALADELAEAVSDRARLRLAYWSASRDETTTRVVTAYRVYTDRGNWYLTALDDRSDEVRTFRVDRIEDLERTGETGPPPPDALPEPGTWFADASVQRATLRLAPAARWVVERYPVDDVSEPDADGWVTARLAVASQRWLERVLLRLGPACEVVEPPELREVAAGAAARALERYRVS
jgi:proteasome accessory factor C